jgi:hypothetical protein
MSLFAGSSHFLSFHLIKSAWPHNARALDEGLEALDAAHLAKHFAVVALRVHPALMLFREMLRSNGRPLLIPSCVSHRRILRTQAGHQLRFGFGGCAIIQRMSLARSLFGFLRDLGFALLALSCFSRKLRSVALGLSISRRTIKRPLRRERLLQD